ncbi:MAG: hypothetical protein HYX38_24695 [Rhodospirillales bacterium]|nr:hypothetical protein [Rhodospirillales bacterium]
MKQFRDGLAWLWWHVMAAVRMLWVCRAAVLPVLVGVALIGLTDQARDIVIADAAPSRKGWPALLTTLIAVTIWATIAWYWARVTVQFTWINPPPPLPHRRWHGWLTVEVPRLIGTAAMLSVALAFWKARTLYDYAGDDKHATRFLVLAIAYVAIAGIFYMVVRERERIARWLKNKGIVGSSWLPDRDLTTEIFDPKHPFARRFLVATVVAAPVFSILVLLLPVWMSDNIFRGAVPAALLGFALMVPVGCYLVMLSAKYELPLFGAAVAALVVSPIVFGDFHDVRTLRVAKSADGSPLTCEQQDQAWMGADKRMMLKDAYFKWWDVNKDLAPKAVDGDLKAPPLIMVATAGGASRAAFWTTQVLGEIAAREPHFTDRLFMISGVSGGSLGAVTFRSLLQAHRLAKKASPVLDKPAEKAREIIENDFLGPTFAAGLYVDLPFNGLTLMRRIVPSAVPPDRGVAIEKAWEAAWEKSGAAGKADLTWDKGFVATFGSDDRPWPALVLNGTSVEKGKRIITSNIRLSSLSSGINRYDTFDMIKADIPISTSVTMSARFPVISPTGALRDCKGNVQARVTDGGLFENFGAYTLDEVLRFLTMRVAEVQNGTHQAAPIAILISSDPSLDRLHLRSDGSRSEATPDCSPVPTDNYPTPTVHSGNRWEECPAAVKDHAELLVDPVLALYDGRVSRGEAAATALHDRIRDAEIVVRDRLAKEINERKRENSLKPMEAKELKEQEEATLEMLRKRLAWDNNIDFFHFRQCRIRDHKSPTMSWHDSAEAWSVLHTMLGLDKGSQDECGNRDEFIRLCIRLARLTEDIDATEACRKKWQAP